MQRALMATAALLMVAAGCATAKAEEVPTYRAFYSGNDLHQACNDTGSDRWGCNGYIAAAADGLSAMGRICPPERVTTTKAMDIVVRNLRDRPEDRHLGAFALAWTALAAVWPCP